MILKLMQAMAMRRVRPQRSGTKLMNVHDQNTREESPMTFVLASMQIRPTKMIKINRPCYLRARNQLTTRLVSFSHRSGKTQLIVNSSSEHYISYEWRMDKQICYTI